MSLNWMILCSKLKNGLWKIVTKSEVVTKFNVTKSRLHCTWKSKLTEIKLHEKENTLSFFVFLQDIKFSCEITNHSINVSKTEFILPRNPQCVMSNFLNSHYLGFLILSNYTRHKKTLKSRKIVINATSKTIKSIFGFQGGRWKVLKGISIKASAAAIIKA